MDGFQAWQYLKPQKLLVDLSPQTCPTFYPPPPPNPTIDIQHVIYSGRRRGVLIKWVSCGKALTCGTRNGSTTLLFTAITCLKPSSACSDREGSSLNKNKRISCVRVPKKSFGSSTIVRRKDRLISRRSRYVKIQLIEIMLKSIQK